MEAQTLAHLSLPGAMPEKLDGLPHPAEERTEPPPNPTITSNDITSTAEKTTPAIIITKYDALIQEESQIPDPAPLPPDLRELNHCLEALSGVFPDIQLEVFREMLTDFDGESRLALVADAILKSRVQWVKGRWRTVDDETSTERNSTDTLDDTTTTTIVPRKESFRSHEYKQAVTDLAWQEFKGLSRSTVHAVLAEANYSYLDARATLVDLSSKSWRYSLSSFFLMRRKPKTAADPSDHPLITWKPISSPQSQEESSGGRTIPLLKATGNAELDRELFRALILPLRLEIGKQTQENPESSFSSSSSVSSTDTEELDCECCFCPCAPSDLTSCSEEGHTVCRQCVYHALSEALFGQGWLQTVNPAYGTLQCLAMDGHRKCSGRIPYDQVQRAMLTFGRCASDDDPNVTNPKSGTQLLEKLDERLMEQSVVAAGVPLVRCPFCEYVEVDDIYMPDSEGPLRLRTDGILHTSFVLACIGTFPLLAMLAVSLIALCLSIDRFHRLALYVCGEWQKAVQRHRKRKRGLRFTCRNRHCGRSSCLECGKAWRDIHICHESALVSLRTRIEQAMSNVVKRVCPQCHIAFVKSYGCNKLTCTCGYQMCYLCRKDIRDVGYRHFCEHFRPDGLNGNRPCSQCDRCNLTQEENTDALLAKAREEAEEEWLASEEGASEKLRSSSLAASISSSSAFDALGPPRVRRVRIGNHQYVIPTGRPVRSQRTTGVAKAGTGGGDHDFAPTAGRAELARDRIFRAVVCEWRTPSMADLLDSILESLFR